METTMNATTVALTDYIISLPDAISKGGANYEVVLTNNTDFIVRRRTQTKERDLVILVSQGLYYIKDCKTEAVEPVTENSLRSFLRDLRDRVLKPADFTFIPGREDMILPAQSCRLIYNDYYGEEAMEEAKKLKPEYLTVARAKSRSIHYAPAC